MCSFILEGKFPFGPKGGHTEKTDNATATLVEFEGQGYVVTCRHVIESVIKDTGNVVCRMTFGPIDLDLSYMAVDDDNLCVQCPSFNISKEYDLAIAKIDCQFVMDLPEKEKDFFQIDKIEIPTIAKDRLVAACGFPTIHKCEKDGKVQAKMVEAVLELTQEFLPTSIDFGISSKIEKQKEEYFFSGMSGGPVIHGEEMDDYLIGVIYEGRPSLPRDEKDDKSFFPEEQKYIRAYTITKERWPEILSTTIPALHYFPEFNRFKPCSANPFVRDENGIEWPIENLQCSIVAKRV